MQEKGNIEKSKENFPCFSGQTEQQENNMIDNPYDSRDPRFEPDPIPVGFMKTVIVTLSKEVKLETTAYEDHIDCDGNGYCTEIVGETDWEQVFKDEHRTIPQLLELLEKECERKKQALERYFGVLECQGEKPTKELLDKKRYWESVIEDCRNWKVDEIDIDDI